MFEEVKRHLNITWDDEITNNDILDIIEAAEAEINSYAGCAVDIAAHPDIKYLFKEMCKYMYCRSYNDFKTNYRSELIMLRARFEVETNEENSDSDI